MSLLFGFSEGRLLPGELEPRLSLHLRSLWRATGQRFPLCCEEEQQEGREELPVPVLPPVFGCWGLCLASCLYWF